MKFTHSASGEKIAYELEARAEGLPLVLLHGFCEDHRVWAPLCAHLKAGSLILIDLPGFGASEPPAEADMRAYADAVLAVLEAENVARCVLIGHSMGGYAALEFAARYSERLAGLGLFHSHPFVDTEERKENRRRGMRSLAEGKRDLYVAQLFPNLFSENYKALHPEVIEKLIAAGRQNSAAGISCALQAMIDRRDHQETLARKDLCPVLFLLGGQDQLIPAADGLKAAMLPQTTAVHLLPQAAHMAMFEDTETAAGILNAFYDADLGGLC